MLGGHRLLLTYKLSLGVLLWFLEWFHMGCAAGAGGAEQSKVGVFPAATAVGRARQDCSENLSCGICYSLCSSSLERCCTVGARKEGLEACSKGKKNFLEERNYYRHLVISLAAAVTFPSLLRHMQETVCPVPGTASCPIHFCLRMLFDQAKWSC